MSSLRLRLLVPLGVGLTLLLVLGGAVLYGAVAEALLSGLDETLLARARSVASHLELRVVPERRARVESLGAAAFGPDGDASAREALLDLAADAFAVHLADGGRLDPAFADGPGDAFFEIRLHDGTVLSRSASLGTAHLGVDRAPGEKPRYAAIVLPDGRHGRVVGLRVDPVPFADPAWQRAWDGIRRGDDLPALGATVLVAQTTADVDASLATLRRALIAFLAALVLGGGVLAFLLVRRGLAPLTDLRRQIEALDPAALDQRVALRRPPAELVPVVDALNQRLDALEEAFERERRTTAHIAHELRTPLAELRSLTEVALQFPDDPALTRQGLEQGHEAALHMTRLVEAVLRLARAQAPGGASRAEPVALAPCVDAAWEGLCATAAAHRQTLASELDAETVARVDPEALGALLANLLGNAVRHAPEGSTIGVAARRRGDRLVLDVTNPCTDLEPDDLERLAEPFWRKDAARSASEQGGLGLALARAWAQAAGVDLAFSLGEGTFTASLHLDPEGGRRAAG